jgi:protocatechuate 3,4-dioxygenase beta subunit
MSFSGRYVPAVLLTFLSFSLTLFAQSTPRQTTKAPSGSISGRVTIKDKGAPGVVMGLRRTDTMSMGVFAPFSKATTDHDGYYRFNNVAAGNYEVAPSAPAYVLATTSGNAGPGSIMAKGKSVLVAEDENVDSINFSLVKGGVITGRVTDADGRPVIQQAVNIFRADAFNQQQPQQPPQIFAVGNAQTDDRGIYRVFGLTGGRYKVAAGRGDETAPSFGMTTGPRYKQVFHPDASEQAKANVIEVTEGSEANNIDITLGRALQTFAATGRVIDAEKNVSVPNVRFGLQRMVGQRREFAPTLITSNAQGDFIAEGLVPGKYSFHLFSNPGFEQRLEAMTFDIVDQDISGITVKLTKGSSLAGVVVIESEDKSALQKLSEMQLRAWMMTSGSGGFALSTTSPIAPDGSFRLSGLSGGTVNIMLASTTSPYPVKGFSIARVERDGVGSSPRVEIKDGEQVTGVRVIVVYGTATLRGVVKLENGTLPDGARIFVRLQKPGDNFSNMMPPQVDARGHFLIDGMAPGVYEVSASVLGMGKQSPAVKREVSLQEGVTTDVLLTIDMGTKPPQP